MKSKTVKSRSYKYLLWMMTTGLVAVAGLATIVFGFVRGHEFTFNTSTGVTWGLLISTYLFFVLPASGLCLLSSLGHIFGVKRFEPFGRRAILLALVMLLSGFLVIAADLERPWLMALYVLITPNPTSAIWWMGTLYAIYFIVLIVEFTLLNRAVALQKLAQAPDSMNIIDRILAAGTGANPVGALRRNKALSRFFGITALFLAVAALSTLGGVFGLTGSRALWHGPMLPVYFVLSALLGGGAVLIAATILTARARGTELTGEVKEAVSGLARLLLVALGVFLLFTVWILLTAQYGRIPADFESVMVLLNGELSLSFWLVEIVIGILAPVALLFYFGTRNIKAVVLAALMVIIGMFVSRFDFIIAGQMVPIVGQEGLWSYTPSLVEVMTVVAAIAMSIFFYSLGERIFPLEEPEPAVDTAPPVEAAGERPPAFKRQPVSS